MAAFTLKHPSGVLSEVEAFSATDAKKSFGAILDAAMAHGIVAITRQNHARAVMLSLEEYEGLLRRLPDPLEQLRGEFDELVAGMRTSKARKAVDALFRAKSTKT
ncbi:MAG TPA: type II toxin-antitoxin system Phd/YefM family antitoxin [Thermoanaerobaculia bacterium]|nr:type II toxin-antitoxin system Phd/YefM family antitoxin [Thermoanaerobaculia bacterium]